MKRLHRMRATQWLRNMSSQVEFTTSHLVQPLFVVDRLSKSEPIANLRGAQRNTLSDALRVIEADLEQGVRHFLLFAIPHEKSDGGFRRDGETAIISRIKDQFGSALHLWVDTCLCSSTSHGHCGLFDSNGSLDLETTLSELSLAALKFAQAGADGISPSDMMDGRVKAIRQTLDENGFSMVPIMSYSTKFSSQFYGPFRDAAQSAPQFGDRKTYQIDVRNRSDAIASSIRCKDEGADLLMVKPGLTSLDLIGPIASQTGLPVGAYQVSGEYAGLELLAERGALDFELALLETWYVYRRAGATFIITYGARRAREIGVHLQ